MKRSRWHSCTVLQTAPEERRLWQFAAGRDSVKPGAAEAIPVNKPLPARLIVKDWKSLLQPRLNIAWLPAGHAYLRVLQLPLCDPGELPAMVEFQLEKISPLPPAQVVWTVEAVPHPQGQQQTAIVAMARRSSVEEFLGKLEEEGFIADRLEIPFLRELLALPAVSDGLWVLAEADLGRVQCLTAWWADGILQELNLSALPAGPEGGERLVEQLTQTAWASELAGWLRAIPQVRLMAGEDVARHLEAPLGDWSGRPVELTPRTSAPRLAELTATHALQPAPTAALVPAEVAQRYHQKWIDRLWIKALSTLAITYMVGVLVYLVLLNLRKYQLDNAQADAVQLGKEYTNTVQLRRQSEVLQDQVALKFAALDCWRAVVENLPTQLTLGTVNFQKGQKLTLDGTAPGDAADEITKFNEKLKEVKVNGQPLFAKVQAAQITFRGGTAAWRFEADLKRAQLQ